jgi:hypothetical protein
VYGVAADALTSRPVVGIKSPAELARATGRATRDNGLGHAAERIALAVGNADATFGASDETDLPNSLAPSCPESMAQMSVVGETLHPFVHGPCVIGLKIDTDTTNFDVQDRGNGGPTSVEARSSR